MIRRFIAYYGPHRRLLVLDLSMAALRSGFAVLIPWVTRDILGRWAPAGDGLRVALYSGVALLLVAGLCVAGYVNTRWGHVLGTRMETDMRRDLFRHLQKLSFSYYDSTKTGHIMSRISNDLFTISEVAHHAPEDLFISGLTLSGALFFMLRMDPALAVIAMAPVPLMLLWGGVFGRRLRSSFREVRRKVADINSSVENSIQGIREVKSFANEPREIERFGDVNLRFRGAKEEMYRKMAGFHAGMSAFTESYRVLVVGAGAFRYMAGAVDLADVLAFLLYVGFILDPIRRIVHFIETYQSGLASFERFIEIMDTEPEIRDRPRARELPGIEGRVTVRDAWFRYAPESDWVLRGISLDIEPGATVALVGESGAGKTTLASLLPRFYEAQRGRILLDGVDVLDLRQRFLRERIGIVQQNSFLFDSTLRENIAFGRPDATEEEIREAARQANLLAFLESLPDGLDTLVGEHGVKLSGGQRQRLAIARVFLKNPPVLIFDEATSSLDTESERLIQEALEALCAGRTTLIIAHRLSTVRRADYTYVLRAGQVVEHGRHEELLALGGYYRRLHEAGGVLR